MNALIVVDVQYDFLPGGALAVPRGDEVIPVANRMMPLFDRVVASQDWHPADHGSFAVNHEGKKPGDVIDLHGLRQVLWPPHCVRNTHGAELADALDRARIDTVIRKGADPGIDSYSAFFDNDHRKKTTLDDYLKREGVTDCYILGLATDYCVKYTALDAVNLEYRTVLIRDGARGIDLDPGDIERAIDEMAEAGVRVTDSDTVARELG